MGRSCGPTQAHYLTQRSETGGVFLLLPPENEGVDRPHAAVDRDGVDSVDLGLPVTVATTADEAALLKRYAI
jgi:hypothetical protein